MTADKPTMQPFRAWVAVHEERGVDLTRISHDRKEIEIDLINLLCVPLAQSGWRIVEVEVREVEK